MTQALTHRPEGRPTKYEPHICEELIKYFDIEPHFETPIITTDKKGNTVEKIAFIPSDLPTLAGFARKKKVHRDTLHEWSKKYPEFSDALKRAKECQEDILVTNGLKGLYEQPFAIFTAKNIMGWRDSKDEPNGLTINGPVQIKIVGEKQLPSENE